MGIDRQWRGPLVAGGLLFAASCVWAYLYWASILDREEDQWRRMAEGLGASLAVLLDEEACPAGADDAVLGAILEKRLRVDPPVVWAALERGGRIIATVGHPPPDGEALSDPGLSDDGRRRVFRVPVGGPPEPADREDRRPRRAPRGDEGPPPGRPDSSRPPRVNWSWDAGVPAGDATLRIAVDTRTPAQVYRRTLPGIAFALLVGWAGIAALVLAWHRSIRSRDLARRLDVEQRERARLEELNLAAAGLAHETKNPLGIILGLAQRIVRDPAMHPETREAAQHIVDAADQASARVSDFLGYARIPKPRLETVPADALLARIAAALRPDFEDAGVRLDMQATPTLISCSPSMLEQVLMNLLLNSLQASGPGSAVTVRLAPRHGTVDLVVEDRGRGIPPTLLPDIFKPYVTSRAEGHGLGLAIVKRIADQHGWTVHVHSVEGEGTSITVAGIRVPGARRSGA